MRYLRQRVLHSLLLLAGVCLLSFAMCELAPGDFFSEMRMNPAVTREAVGAMRAQYGLDQPPHVRFANWASSALRGEFGFSLSYNAPVGPLVLARALNTLLLTSLATALAWLAAIPLAMRAARCAGSWQDHASQTAATALLCVPDVLMALGFMLLAFQTGWFPTSGMTSLDFAQFSAIEKIKDVAWHAALPVLALALGIAPAIFRHARGAIREAMSAPFVDAARGHGISEERLMLRFILPSAANPLISLLGLTIGNLLGASLLIEVVMGWPGLGPLLIEAIFARDFLVVIGVTFFSTVLLMASNLATDVALFAADPRIRVKI